MELGTLSEISKSLPEGFPFYSFGEVSPSATDSLGELSSTALEALLTGPLAGKAGVSFRLLGDPAALLIVVFDEELDASMYCELGNILASKLCQKLSERGEGDLMITPPLLLAPSQLARLSRARIPCVHRSYRHVDGTRVVRLEALILPIPAQAQGLTSGGALDV